ncbi:MAG: Mor transcription activator family protein [Thiobacillus sp.]|jgi:Mor family transcriptional regulator|uniref:Mor transcription activator family protein n=1 Tax=Thiobacillus sp. TaxID=924 RepID=UPI002896105D|nr:Mor transcription activator family protein [Thiobacillus sp.]MDT3706489.1 Mor transcription activator family protein [Thiobacillus sp.]
MFTLLLRKVLEEAKSYSAAEIEVLVRQAESALRASCGGKHVYVPNSSKAAALERDAKIARDRRNGVSVQDIMSKYGLSRAAVYKVLKNREIHRPKK